MPVFVPLSDPLGINPAGDRARVSDGRGLARAAHADQRCADGGVARRERAVSAMAAICDRGVAIVLVVGVVGMIVGGR